MHRMLEDIRVIRDRNKQLSSINRLRHKQCRRGGWVYYYNGVERRMKKWLISSSQVIEQFVIYYGKFSKVIEASPEAQSAYQ